MELGNTESTDSDGVSSSSQFRSFNIKNESSTPYSDATNCKITHVKRPMNPFMVWSQIERRKLVEKEPYLNHMEVSKQLGRRWKCLTFPEKLPFVKEAEKLRILHSQEFPDYKYSPKKRKSKISQHSSPKKMLKYVASANGIPLSSLEDFDKVAENLCAKKKCNPKSVVIENNRKKKEIPKSSTSADIFSNSLKHDLKSNVKKKFSKSKISSTNTSKFLIGEKRVTQSLKHKQIWDFLQETKITSLAIDKTTSKDSFTNTSDSIKKLNAPTKKTLPLYIDGCLTSGSIAALACYRDNWADTFDYLTDKVLQSSKNIYEEINNISTHYEEIISYKSEFDDSLPPELQTPDINKILGKNWKDPNFGLKFLS